MHLDSVWFLRTKLQLIRHEWSFDRPGERSSEKDAVVAYSSMFCKLELRSSQELELRSVAGHFENCKQVYFTTLSNLAMDKFYFTCFAHKRCWAMGLGLSHACSLSLDKSATSPDPPHEMAKLNCCCPQFCCHSILKEDRPAACLSVWQCAELIVISTTITKYRDVSLRNLAWVESFGASSFPCSRINYVTNAAKKP